MAANSDMNSPIDSIMNDVLNGCNQPVSQQDVPGSQTNDARKRLPAKKNEAQSGVKITFQLPKNVAIRLKRFAEKLPTTLTDCGLLSVHFLGERTIQLANREANVPDGRDVRQPGGESTWATLSASDSGDATPVRFHSSSVTDERHVPTATTVDDACTRLTQDATLTRFAMPLGLSVVSPQPSTPSLDGAAARCTASSPCSTTTVSVALVTSNGLKLRVRTAPIATPSPLECDPLNTTTQPLASAGCDRPTLNGTHRHGEPDGDSRQQRRTGMLVPADDVTERALNGSVHACVGDSLDDEDERFTALRRPNLFTDDKRVAVARPKRRDAPALLTHDGLSLSEKRAKVQVLAQDSGSASALANHHLVAALGVNGVLQNGHANSTKCERDSATQNGLLLRNSKPLNGVRCGVAPRAVQTISSATASDSL